ncbi:MAG: clan AA aspartic protease [Candidatus Delongbacteria bacterium]|nr:clan AA aspartic protease [Candidatus Delongbacteria bacterium]MBN2834615.1 clan AA aspartic protease [Candidatus Delongbacteria bacterium]
MTKIYILLLIVTIANSSELNLILKKHKDFSIQNKKKISSFHIVSKVNAYGFSGESDSWYIYPDKFFVKMDLGIMSQTQAFDGIDYYEIDRNGKREKKGDPKDIDKAYLSAFMSSMAYLEPENFNLKVVDKGDIIFEGKSCRAVAYSFRQSKETTLYIDKDSGAAIASVTNEMGMNVVEKRYNYKNFSGFMINTSSDVTISGGLATMKVENDLIEINKKVPQNLFVSSESAKDYQFLSRNHKSTSKIKIVNGHIFLKVKINDSGYRYFIYDTGAMTTVLDKEFAKYLNLTESGNLPGLGAGGVSSASLAEIDSIRIKDLLFGKQSVAIMDFSQLQLMFPIKINGLVGYDFASRVVTEIDYEKEEITFYEPDFYNPPSDFERLKASLYNKLLLVDCTVNGVEGRFFLDTGSNSGVDISQDFAKKAGLSDKEGFSSAVSGIGGLSNSKTINNIEVILGSKKQQVSVSIHSAKEGVFAQEDVAGIIGSQIFGKKKLITDYKNRVIYLSD